MPLRIYWQFLCDLVYRQTSNNILLSTYVVTWWMKLKFLIKIIFVFPFINWQRLDISNQWEPFSYFWYEKKKRKEKKSCFNFMNIFSHSFIGNYQIASMNLTWWHMHKLGVKPQIQFLTVACWFWVRLRPLVGYIISINYIVDVGLCLIFHDFIWILRK